MGQTLLIVMQTWATEIAPLVLLVLQRLNSRSSPFDIISTLRMLFQSLVGNSLFLLLAEAIPLTGDIFVAKEGSNFFQCSAFCLGEPGVSVS
jgi:hypothetical protein